MHGAAALIVEDNPHWLGIFRDELLRSGYCIDFAFKRDDAIRKIADPPFPYDIVVLDTNLGDSLGGLAGITIAEKVAASSRPSAVMVVSGLATVEELRSDYLRLTPPVVAVFEKRNFALAEFRDAVHRVRGVGTDEAMFAPDYARLRSLWQRACETEDAAEKGEVLERLGIEMLTSIPLLTLGEARSRSLTAEVDAVLSVYAAAGTLCQDWGRLLLVECRNRATKFNASSVRDFAGKLEASDAKVGVVLSVAGLTGSDKRDARGAIDDVFARQRRIIILLDRSEIDGVVKGDTNLYTLLHNKDLEVRTRRM